MRLDVHTHQLDTIWCNWTCLDMQLDISVTIVLHVPGWCGSVLVAGLSMLARFACIACRLFGR